MQFVEKGIWTSELKIIQKEHRVSEQLRKQAGILVYILHLYYTL